MTEQFTFQQLHDLSKYQSNGWAAEFPERAKEIRALSFRQTFHGHYKRKISIDTHRYIRKATKRYIIESNSGHRVWSRAEIIAKIDAVYEQVARKEARQRKDAKTAAAERKRLAILLEMLPTGFDRIASISRVREDGRLRVTLELISTAELEEVCGTVYNIIQLRKL